MLSNSAVELVSSIEQKKTMLLQRKNIQSFNSRKNQLAGLSTKLAKVFQTYNVLKEKGIQTGDFNGQLADAARKLKEVNQKYLDDPSWIKDQNALDQLSRKIDKLTNDMSGNFLEVWKGYINKQVPALNTEILSILGKISSFRVTTSEINRIFKSIQQEIGVLPTSAQDILKMETKCKLLIDKWNHLGADDVPHEVLTFLRGTGTPSGASLSMLTEEVVKWLEQHRLDSFISIRMNQ
ncbi:hypothetical protein ABES02_28155 [Neobacillus pocheonensis]|uniref:hypothetical protein n=1 Tax=Neobacillus pocheonensis TaxID=363869 RepID=UPI003D2B49BF